MNHNSAPTGWLLFTMMENRREQRLGHDTELGLYMGPRRISAA